MGGAMNIHHLCSTFMNKIMMLSFLLIVTSNCVAENFYGLTTPTVREHINHVQCELMTKEGGKRCVPKDSIAKCTCNEEICGSDTKYTHYKCSYDGEWNLYFDEIDHLLGRYGCTKNLNYCSGCSILEHRFENCYFDTSENNLLDCFHTNSDSDWVKNTTIDEDKSTDFETATPQYTYSITTTQQGKDYNTTTEYSTSEITNILEGPALYGVIAAVVLVVAVLALSSFAIAKMRASNRVVFVDNFRVQVNPIDI